MGKSLETHRGTFSSGGWMWYVGGILVLGAVLCLAGVSGPAANQSLAERAPTAGVALLLALLLLTLPVLRLKQSVEVFERGLVWTRLYRVVRVPAEQVRSASWIQHHGRTSYDEIKVELTNGTEYSIIGIEGPEQLLNFLRAWSAPGVGTAAPAPVGWAAPAAPTPETGWKPPRS